MDERQGTDATDGVGTVAGLRCHCYLTSYGVSQRNTSLDYNLGNIIFLSLFQHDITSVLINITDVLQKPIEHFHNTNFSRYVCDMPTVYFYHKMLIKYATRVDISYLLNQISMLCLSGHGVNRCSCCLPSGDGDLLAFLFRRCQCFQKICCINFHEAVSAVGLHIWCESTITSVQEKMFS